MHDCDTIIRSELQDGEELLWIGKPYTGIMLRSHDIFLIPFSLVWTGGVLFIGGTFILSSEKSTSAFEFMFAAIIALFLCVGAYITVGRFLVDQHLRKRTCYAVTDRRAILARTVLGRTYKSVDVRNCPDVELSENASGTRGTITFGTDSPHSGGIFGAQRQQSAAMWPGLNWGMLPVMEGVENPREPYNILLSLREKG